MTFSVNAKDVGPLDSVSVSKADVLELFRIMASGNSEASIRAIEEKRSRIPAPPPSSI
jgi:hypothetical protein